MIEKLFMIYIRSIYVVDVYVIIKYIVLRIDVVSMVLFLFWILYRNVNVSIFRCDILIVYFYFLIFSIV